MKKILALLLALMMALSLCACGKDKAEAPEKSKTEIVGNALNGTVWGESNEIDGATLIFTHNFYASADSDGGKASWQGVALIEKTGEVMHLTNMQGTFSVDAGDVNKIYVTYNANVSESGAISAADKPTNITFEYELNDEEVTKLILIAESGVRTTYYKLDLD